MMLGMVVPRPIITELGKHGLQDPWSLLAVSLLRLANYSSARDHVSQEIVEDQ